MQDEVVKLSPHARAIRDVEDEELRSFFYGMSPWQVTLGCSCCIYFLSSPLWIINWIGSSNHFGSLTAVCIDCCCKLCWGGAFLPCCCSGQYLCSNFPSFHPIYLFVSVEITQCFSTKIKPILAGGALVCFCNRLSQSLESSIGMVIFTCSFTFIFQFFVGYHLLCWDLFTLNIN